MVNRAGMTSGMAANCVSSIAAKASLCTPTKFMDNCFHGLVCALTQQIFTVTHIQLALQRIHDQPVSHSLYSALSPASDTTMSSSFELSLRPVSTDERLRDDIVPRRHSEPYITTPLLRSATGTPLTTLHVASLLSTVAQLLLCNTNFRYDCSSETDTAQDPSCSVGSSAEDIPTEGSGNLLGFPLVCRLPVLPPQQITRPSLPTPRTDDKDIVRPSVETNPVNEVVSKQGAEISMLRETIARQTLQLTQLTMQVADLKTEADQAEHDLQHVPTEIGLLKQKVAALTQENKLLEAQLEEQNSLVRQTFELRCALQRMHMEMVNLKKDSSTVNTTPKHLLGDEESDPTKRPSTLKLLSKNDTHSDLYVSPPSPLSADEPLSALDQESETPREELLDAKNDNASSSEEYPEDVENGDDENLEQLLQDVSLRASQAALQLEMSELKAELEKTRLREAAAIKRAEASELVYLRITRNRTRALQDVKTMLRRERAEREQLERECQRLLAKVLEMGWQTVQKNPVKPVTSEKPLHPDAPVSGPVTDHSTLDLLSQQLAVVRETEHNLKMDVKRKNLTINYLVDLCYHKGASAGVSHAACDGPFTLTDYPLPSTVLQSSYAQVFGVVKEKTGDMRHSPTSSSRLTQEEMLHIIKGTIEETQKDLRTKP